MYTYEDFPEEKEMPEGMQTLQNSDEALEAFYHRDVEYVNYDGVKRVLQILVPNKRENKNEGYPLILFVQGSAWRKQDIYKRLPQLGYVARKGFTVALVQYRESEIAPFPAQVQDTKAAIRFLRKHAGQYRINPDQVFLWGDSSGGHTALLAGMTADSQNMQTEFYEGEKEKVNAIIDFYGVVDIRMPDGFPNTPNHQQADSAEGMLMGGRNINEIPEEAKKSVPMEYIGPDTPPILIMHGTKDRTVSFKHSVKLYEALKKKGKVTEFYRICGADHGSPAFYTDDTLDLMISFIRKYIKK